MSKVVLDASALLALLNNEPGAEKLTLRLLAGAVVSTVNLAEVQSWLVKAGIDPADAWQATITPVAEIAAFTAEQAKIAGSLTALTRALGLSLGDRACLALAIALGAPVYTADRSWKGLRLGISIHLIR
jgi:PIN domain nuclease of toxin-antitoxin system